MQPEPKDKIILPLDVPDADAARRLAGQLRGRVGLFKFGLQLFTAAGPGLVREILEAGDGVFLDLKFHDIPNTVRHAVESAAGLGVQMTTIHLSGGPEMIRAAVAGAGGTPLRVLGVTVLTSSDAETLRACGTDPDVAAQVLRLAALGVENGIGGLVASPKEVPALRSRFGTALPLVIPGIRPAWAAANDQKRILTPAEAVRAGADYLVIGRPITDHPEPATAADRIAEEIAGALA